MNITKKTVEQPIMEEVLTKTGVKEVEVWEVEGKEFFSEQQAERYVWEKSIKKEDVSFPWNCTKVFLESKNDYKRFEEMYISNYYTEKKYDESKLEFPNIYILHFEESSERMGEAAILVKYDEFRKIVIDELDRIKE